MATKTPKPKNAPWDPHAHECYSCEFGSRPPRHCTACKGCINRDSRPHWVMKSIYTAAASAAIAKAATKDTQP